MSNTEFRTLRSLARRFFAEGLHPDVVAAVVAIAEAVSAGDVRAGFAIRHVSKLMTTVWIPDEVPLCQMRRADRYNAVGGDWRSGTYLRNTKVRDTLTSERRAAIRLDEPLPALPELPELPEIIDLEAAETTRRTMEAMGHGAPQH